MSRLAQVEIKILVGANLEDSILIPKDLWKRFKKAAAYKGMTWEAAITSLTTDYCNKVELDGLRSENADLLTANKSLQLEIRRLRGETTPLDWDSFDWDKHSAPWSLSPE